MYKPKVLGQFQKRAKRQLCRPQNVTFPFNTHSGDSIYAICFVRNASSKISAFTPLLKRGVFSFSSFPNLQLPNHDNCSIANTGTKPWIPNLMFRRQISSSSSSSSVDSVESVWRQTTQRLLHDTPIGGFTENNWNECQKCILWWLETPPENDNISSSLQEPFLLLDRVCLEANSTSTSVSKAEEGEEGVIETTNGPKLFDTDLLNLVVNHWRKSVSDSSSSFQIVDEDLHPQNIIERLHGFRTSESYLKPNTQTYAMIIDGASAFNDRKEDGIIAAERLFEWLMEESLNNVNLRPNVYTFTSLMDGWNKSGRLEAASKVQELLNRMEVLDREYPDWEIAPNMFSYSVAIDSWAKLGKVEEVENLMYEIRQKYTELGAKGLKPTIRIFNGYLVALAKAGQLDRAQSVIEQMHDLYNAGELDEPPSVISYSTVLDACAKSNYRDAGERAELILRQMLDKGVDPNTVSYNTVIDAYVRSGRFDRAEYLLSEMHAESLQGNLDIKPMAQTYTVVLSGLSKSKSKNAGERGEKLLVLMKDLARSGELDQPPNVFAYNSVLDCWAKSSSKDAPERAKKFLQQMIDRDDVEPDLYSYNTVLAALARAGKIKDAEAMFHTIPKRDATTYNTLLAALTKSGSVDDASNRVNELFSMMKKDKEVEPDLITYNIVLNAHAISGSLGQAEAVLDEMMDDASTVQPDIYSFNTIISAWSKSGRDDAPEQVESILNSMLSESSKVAPDAITFNTLLGVWVKSKLPEAAKRCERILGIMNDLFEYGDNHSVRPDAVSYNALIRACQYHHPVEEGPDIAESAFHEMQRRSEAGERWLKPTAKTYGSLIHVWSTSGRREAGEQAEMYLRDLIHRSDQGDWNEKLRIYEFIATIEAWRNSGDQRAIYKTDEVMHLLLKCFRNSGREAVHPNARLFETILKTLVASSLHNKPKYADRLVSLMKEYGIKPRAEIIYMLKRCYSERIATRDTNSP